MDYYYVYNERIFVAIFTVRQLNKSVSCLLSNNTQGKECLDFKHTLVFNMYVTWF